MQGTGAVPRKSADLALTVSERLTRVAALTGFTGLALGAWALSFDRMRAIHAYFTAFGFVTTLGLGGLFLTLLHYVLNARWSAATTLRARPIVGLLPWCALLFAPILLWAKEIFPWLESDCKVHTFPISNYLHGPSFYIRAGIYWFVWLGLAYVYGHENLQKADSNYLRFARRLSGPAVVVFAFTTTFAAFDWFMSLQPEWHSAIFGVYVFGGTVTSALGFIAIGTVVLEGIGLVSSPLNADTRHDIGKSLFGFVAFWAYVAFSQYLLIWYAGLTSETSFFQTRLDRAWLPTTVVLFTMHFAVPFVGLLSATAKRSVATLCAISAVVLVAHAVDLFWLVMPALESGRSRVCLADFPAVLIIACILLILISKVIETELRWPDTTRIGATADVAQPQHDCSA